MWSLWCCEAGFVRMCTSDVPKCRLDETDDEDIANRVRCRMHRIAGLVLKAAGG